MGRCAATPHDTNKLPRTALHHYTGPTPEIPPDTAANAPSGHTGTVNNMDPTQLSAEQYDLRKLFKAVGRVGPPTASMGAVERHDASGTVEVDVGTSAGDDDSGLFAEHPGDLSKPGEHFAHDEGAQHAQHC